MRPARSSPAAARQAALRRREHKPTRPGDSARNGARARIIPEIRACNAGCSCPTFRVMGPADVSKNQKFPLRSLPESTFTRLCFTFTPLVIAVVYVAQWYLEHLEYESRQGSTHSPLNVVEFIFKPLALGLIPTLVMFFALNILGHLGALSRVRRRPGEIVWAYEHVQIQDRKSVV